MSSNRRPSARGGWRWVHPWRLIGLALGVVTVVVAVLEVWATPPGWLHGSRGLVVNGLHWLRVHWLTSGALGALLAGLTLLLGLSQNRVERQRAEREQAERKGAAQNDRAALLAAHGWVDPATKGLPSVSSVQDPVTLGVHPAAAVKDPDTAAGADAAAGGLGLPGRVPVYVPRDLDARLDAALAHALAHGGLVLLRGDSTAGKSRAAFEAMRRLPGDLGLLVPTQRGSVRALLDGGVELHEVVVWLNDLERYLGADGLDVGLLRRLVGDGRQRVLVLATMRASEYNARSPERQRHHPSPERDVLQAERELLDQAVDFELTRRFSAAEHARAGERAWDSRIADALAHAGQYGLAEYLAAGPRLWRRWCNARAVDNPDHEQAGAAIVAAALDCRRAGLTRPAPTLLLQQLFRDQAYLDPAVAGRLSPDAFDQGLAWARIPVQATSALLTTNQGGEVVFDYLLDNLQADLDTPAVPTRVWECVLADLHPDDAFAIGMAAYADQQHEFAVRAWQVAADAGDHKIEHNLGLLHHERGDLEEAERWYRRAAEAGELRAQNNLGALLSQRGDFKGAERWYRRAVDTGDHRAEFNLGLMLSKRGNFEGAEGWLRRAADGSYDDAVPVLGIVLAQLGDLDEAEDRFRHAANSGDHRAEFYLGQLLTQREDKEAERWLRRAANGGHHEAEHLLAALLAERGDLREAEHWYRRAAEGGHHDAEYSLGRLLMQQGHFQEAEPWYRRAADASNHDAEYALGILLSLRADHKEAESLLIRAADGGNHRAEQLLGVLLAHRGELKEAEHRWRHAADSGNQDAEQLLQELLAKRDDLKRSSQDSAEND